MAEAGAATGTAPAPAGELLIPDTVNVGNVAAVMEGIAAECKARRYTAESRVVVNLARLKDFDSTALSMLLEMARHAGKPVAVINPPPKLTALATLYGVESLLLEPQGEAADTPAATAA